MRLTAFAGSIVGIAACTAAPGAEVAESVGSARQAIVGGAASDSEQDATVLINQAGEPSCTGSLIASNLVLTARHCVTAFNENDECGAPLSGELAPSIFTVSVGMYASPARISARGVRVYVPDATANALCGGDIALLLLDQEIAATPIARVRFAAPANDEMTTAVGYGDRGSGREQRTDVAVLAVGPTTAPYVTKQGRTFSMQLPTNDFATSESTCFGDSGGPLLDASNQVIAVASRGLPDDPEACIDRPTYWTSVAPYEELIRGAASDAGHPLPRATGGAALAAPTSNETPAMNGGTERSAYSSSRPSGAKQTAEVGAAGCSAGGRDFARRTDAGSGGLMLGLGLGFVGAIRGRRRGSRALGEPHETRTT